MSKFKVGDEVLIKYVDQYGTFQQRKVIGKVGTIVKILKQDLLNGEYNHSVRINEQDSYFHEKELESADYYSNCITIKNLLGVK